MTFLISSAEGPEGAGGVGAGMRDALVYKRKREPRAYNPLFPSQLYQGLAHAKDYRCMTYGSVKWPSQVYTKSSDLMVARTVVVSRRQI